ncbi:MAG: FGGY family carbohydrate kinase [Candidatus Latescibacterota bacterium]|nr:FGGY family carbohydrate kinase [Candidatus Latescibacterota bacterium]
MPNFLAVDFGTTSTKSVLVDLDSGAFSRLERHPSIPSEPTTPGRHQVALSAIAERFQHICASAWSHTSFEGIVLCSEMHGFALLDDHNLKPLSPYISWLDARALERIGGVSTYDLVTDRLTSDRFREITGMQPRPSDPIFNLTHHLRSGPPPTTDGTLVVSLPGWLALSASAGSHAATHANRDDFGEHPTMLAGMAFFDVGTHENSQLLVNLVAELTGLAPILGTPVSEETAVGHWSPNEGAAARRVPIYVGVGDHQCSALGAGLIGPGRANLNLGTGSQIAVVDGPTDPEHFELRPYFDSQTLSAVTRIPAGRALAEYVGFLERVATFGDRSSDAPDFWALLADVDVAEVEAAPLDVSLAVFDGARNYDRGGSLSGIHEGTLAPRPYLASVLKAFARQYAEILELFDPDRELEELLLSGGIARNLPRVAEFLRQAAGYERIASAAELDESLLGLRTLAIRASGREPTVSAAQARFGHDYTLID